MKNYWNIVQDYAYFSYGFELEKNQYDIELIKEILELVVLSGWKYGVIKVFDQVAGKPFYDDFLRTFNSILDNNGSIDTYKSSYDFFWQAFPNITESYKNPHVIVTELAYYNLNGEIEIKDVFSNEVFYPLLNPHRVHLYHYNKTSNYSPISLELGFSLNRKLSLSIGTGLGIWFPFFKPDYDMDKQSLKDFPLNEFGYIDNRELYLLNTPRLIGFIKELRKFFEKHHGKERSNNAQLEKFPEFPWYS